MKHTTIRVHAGAVVAWRRGVWHVGYSRGWVGNVLSGWVVNLEVPKLLHSETTDFVELYGK